MEVPEHQINPELIFPVLNRSIAWGVNFLSQESSFLFQFYPASKCKLHTEVFGDLISWQRINTPLGQKGPLSLSHLIPNFIFPLTRARISFLFLICFAGLFLLYVILPKLFSHQNQQEVQLGNSENCLWRSNLSTSNTSCLLRKITTLPIPRSKAYHYQRTCKLAHGDDFGVRMGGFVPFCFPTVILVLQ